MNSKERIRCALAHKQPDRAPIDLGSTTSSGISVEAYASLLKYLKRNDPIYVYDVVQQLARIETDILEDFSVDVYDVGVAMERKNDDFWTPIELPSSLKVYFPTWFKPKRDESGGLEVVSEDGIVYAKMGINTSYFSQTFWPWKNEWPQDLYSYVNDSKKTPFLGIPQSPFDRECEPNFWNELRKNCVTLQEQSKKALILSVGCSFLEAGTFMRGIEDFFVDLCQDTVQVERFLDVLLELHLELLEKVCKLVGDIVDVIRLTDDMGMLLSPLISPGQYRSIFKPRLKKLCDFIHDNSSMHTFIHSCGAIEPLLPHMIEAGIEIINPVQINCVGMDAVSLKKNYGKDLVFWGGGCDTREILNTKSPEEIKDHVKKQVEVLCKDGGFVFTQVHNIMPDVPPENIIAMYEALQDM